MSDEKSAEAARDIVGRFLVYGDAPANDELYRAILSALVAAEGRGRAEERERTLNLFTSGEFCKMPDHPKECLCPIVEEVLRARPSVGES